MRSLSLLEASKNPQVLQVELLRQRLMDSCSTWEHQSQKPSAESGLIAAATNNGWLVSTAEIGLSEMLSGVWIRKRISAGLNPIKLSNMDRLNEEQRRAAHILCENPVSCLYGLPGTGKTFVLKTVYDSLIAAGKRVAILSFTGGAASRLGEVIGASGSTIHRYLGYNQGRFIHTREDPTEDDAIIIDEAGQLSSVLHYNLLNGIREDCHVIYTGDPNQLGSIEPGNTLSDLISSIPSAELVQIQRTNPNGPIGMAARAMLDGNIPHTQEDKGDGFYLKPCIDSKIIEIGFLAHKRMADIHSVPFHKLRALCPTNKLVSEYNAFCLKNYDGIIPIIGRKNNYDDEYFNGDTGILVDGEFVQFDNGAYVKFINKPGIHEFGFASTVYVAQGREWPASMLLLPHLGCGRPNFSAVYTAITRAKNRFIVIGSMNNFIAAIRARNKLQRTTLLPSFVRGEAEVLQARS